MSKRSGKQQSRQWEPDSGKNGKLPKAKRQLIHRRKRREAEEVIEKGLEMYEWLAEVGELAD